MPSKSPVTRLLLDLVSTPSINPSLAPSNSKLTGEEGVATLLADQAGKLGIEIQRQAVLPGRKNILLRLRPKGKIKSRVMLAPHMDVVPAEESSFKPMIKKGKLYGRGACDTKGSMAAFFQAFCDLARYGPLPLNTEIIFVGLVDEEFCQAGSRMLSKKGPRADLAIAGEPTNLKVVSAHKGNLWLKLKSSGIAAHGSTPQHGVNAIEKMASIIRTISEEYPKILLKKSHKLLGEPTFNIGRISGGKQPNIVPDNCEIEIDRRTVPGETQEEIEKEIKRLLQNNGISEPEFTAVRTVPCPPLETETSLPLVRDFLKSTRRRKTIGVPYFTDAAPLSNGGTPSLVYGPGNIAQAHAKDEWISLSEVENAKQYIFHFLSNLA